MAEKSKEWTEDCYPEFKVDQQGDKYTNDVPLSSWLRNGNACSKPSFDHTGKATKDKV